jgi:polyisoprenoid-binding protein YceI
MTRTGILLAAFSLSTVAMAQESGVLTVQEGSTVFIDGTSNKSDWTVEASEMSGTFELEAGTVVSAQFSVAGASIKGGAGVIQNRLITKALKTPTHPDITFSLTEVTGSEDVDGGTRLSTTGTLMIAGVEQEIALYVLVSEAEGGLRFVGEHPVTMPDYKIKPPTAMFGALHVAKEVLVRFDVVAGAAAEAGTQ